MVTEICHIDGHAGVEVAPPPSRDEPVPDPRPGYAWIPGYWDWRGARHVWTVGRWMPERRGYHWQRHRWVLREGRWYLQAGGWASDREERMPHAHDNPLQAR